MKILDLLLNFVYPPRCCICGSLMGMFNDRYICEECAKNADFAEENTDFTYTLREKFNSNIYFDFGMSVFKYHFVKDSIERFKYSGERNLGKFYAEIMYNYFSKRGIFEGIDFIVSVPLSKKRFKSRGYNQSEFIAHELSRFTGIKHAESALIRKRDTVPQSLLKANERYDNVKDAFETAVNFKDKSVLIVDDIFTTGATINECAKALKMAGAKRVGFITFASAGND